MGRAAFTTCVRTPSETDYLSVHFLYMFLLAVGAMLALVITPDLAHGSIHYGDFGGTTVEYLDVTEESQTDMLPLFGTPTVSGNSLDFSPVGFTAYASGATGIDVTAGGLTFGLRARPETIIDTILLSEAGDTLLLGMGTDATYTCVAANAMIDILEVDGIPITPIGLQNQFVFTPSDGDYHMGVDGNGGPIYRTIWKGSLTIDLTQALVDHGISFDDGVTLARLQIDNRLTAQSEAGTAAFIAKKDFDVIGLTVDVSKSSPVLPEPVTLVVWSLLICCGVPLARRSHAGVSVHRNFMARR